MVSHLIEPGVRYFYKKTLQGCHNVKEQYYNSLYNLGLFVFFILLVGIILYFKRKYKPSLDDREKQKRLNYEYIVSKVRNFQDGRSTQVPKVNLDLPVWQNNPEIQIYDKKIYM